MANKSAGWGWEVVNINNNGSDAYFQVKESITLTGLMIDVSYMPTATPKVGGYAEVLCQGYALPTLPTFGKGQAYFTSPPAVEFGPPQIVNPNGSIEGQSVAVSSGQLFAVILKSWVANPPIASHTERGVFTYVNLPIAAGEYLAFHMDHMGVPGDVEMQLTLFY